MNNDKKIFIVIVVSVSVLFAIVNYRFVADDWDTFCFIFFTSSLLLFPFVILKYCE
jgi:hypothetical protein